MQTTLTVNIKSLTLVILGWFLTTVAEVPSHSLCHLMNLRAQHSLPQIYLIGFFKLLRGVLDDIINTANGAAGKAFRRDVRQRDPGISTKLFQLRYRTHLHRQLKPLSCITNGEMPSAPAHW